MTLPHESKEGAGQTEAKEAGGLAPEDTKVEQETGGAVAADDRGGDAEQAGGDAEQAGGEG